MNVLDNLDLIDKKIIELLQKNPNVSYAEMANTVNKSQPAIGARITKLNRNGFTNLSYGVNFRTSQLPFFLCDLESNEPNRVVDRAQNCPFIINVLHRTGQINLTLLVTATSIEKFTDIVEPCLRRDKSIQHINSIPIIKMKEDLIIPLNLDIELYEKIKCSNECPFKEKKDFPSNSKIEYSIISKLNQHPEIKQYFENLLISIMKISNCDGAGIRFIESTTKMPYYVSHGLPDSILKHEEIGQSNRCVCESVYKMDHQPNFLTKNGSYIFQYHDLINEQDLKPKTHAIEGFCINKDFNTIALIPIQSNEMVFGIIYIGEKNGNKINDGIISKLESAANLIASSIFNLIYIK